VRELVHSSILPKSLVRVSRTSFLDGELGSSVMGSSLGPTRGSDVVLLTIISSGCVPLKIRVDIVVSSISSKMNENARASLACITTTEAAVADAAARWAQPLLHSVHTSIQYIT